MNIHEIEEYRRSINSIAMKIPSVDCRILVTGASGLIGSCLVDTLICANRSHRTNFQIYALGRNKEKLMNRFSYDDSVKVLSQDVACPIDVTGLDYIIHAASFADPLSYAKYPAETILTNVLGAKSVLDYCKGKKTRALLTSTFEVYGKTDKDGLVEEDYGLIDQNQLRSSYPESKRVAELLFRSYYAEHSVDCLVARLPSVYGPTMSDQDNKAHAEFIRNAVNKQDIILKSAGDQKRTYCYVVDIVSGLLYLLFYGKSGEVYNVTNPEAITTIAELAYIIADIAGTNVVYDWPNDEVKEKVKPQNSVLKTGKINQLGWFAHYDLQEGIRETIEIVTKMQQND